MSSGFIVNAHRIDPYKNYKFLLKMDGVVVLGVSKVTPLKKSTEVIPHRSGGDNGRVHKAPGRTSYEAITLERGKTESIQFEEWANKVHPYPSDDSKDLVGFRKDLILEVMNERGQAVLKYNLYGCWVSEFTTFPDLDANANAIAIESVKIELDGWVRDFDYKFPSESA